MVRNLGVLSLWASCHGLTPPKMYLGSYIHGENGYHPYMTDQSEVDYEESLLRMDDNWLNETWAFSRAAPPGSCGALPMPEFGDKAYVQECSKDPDAIWTVCKILCDQSDPPLYVTTRDNNRPFRLQCHPQTGWTPVHPAGTVFKCIGPCPGHVSQNMIAKTKAFTVPTTFGDKRLPKEEKKSINLRVLMRTSRLGANGWYAAVKFAKPLPEDVSFTSPEVVKRYMSPDRTMVTFEPKPWKIQTINGANKYTQAFKVIIDGISMNSHIDPDNMEVFFVPFENISSNWGKGPDLSCKMTIDDGQDDNDDNNGDDSDGNDNQDGCVTASVSQFDKCDTCSAGLVQLQLDSPFQGKWKSEIKFNGIGAAGLVTPQVNGVFVNNEFSYEGWTRAADSAKYVAYGNEDMCWNEAISFSLDGSALPAGYEWDKNVEATICFNTDDTYPDPTTTTQPQTEQTTAQTTLSTGMSTTPNTTGASTTPSTGATTDATTGATSPVTTGLTTAPSTTEAVTQGPMVCYSLNNDQYQAGQSNYWNNWDNGQITSHVLQHALEIPISDNVFDWTLELEYPFVMTNFDSWETSTISSIPAGQSKSTKWQIQGISGWGTGTEIRTNFQLECLVEDFSGTVTPEAFLPSSVKICLPSPVVPGEGPVVTEAPTTGPSTTSGATEQPTQMTTTQYTGPSTTFATSTSTSTEAADCSGPSGIVAVNPVETSVPNTLGTSPNYAGAMHLSILFYEAQMSGPLPDWHRVKWRGDSALNDGCDVGYDLTGGFYDAGDFVKFHFPQSFALNTLGWGMSEFKAGYQSAGEWQNALRILKWGIDHFKKCQPTTHPEYPNIFYGQIGNGHTDHAYWGRPEEMSMDRPSYAITASQPGSDLAGGVASAFASAALVFGQEWGWDNAYAQDCLKRAREMLSFATNHVGKYSDSITNAKDFYTSWSGYNDEIVLAGAWIAKASSMMDTANHASDVANAKKGSLYSQFPIGTGGEFSWDNKEAGANLMMHKITGDSQYLQKFNQFKTTINNGSKTPGGMWFIQQWGSVRHAANAAFLFASSGDKASAKEQIDFILGHGSRGTPMIDGQAGSYLIGYGSNYPTKPHHGSASCPATGTCDWNDFNSPNDNPWTLHGAIIGGPESPVDNLTNDRGNYVTNEVAIDYNAGFQGVLAALLS